MLPGVRASTYCVIPIGATTGMIEWIEGRTSVFHVYQRWWQVSNGGASGGTNSSTNSGTNGGTNGGGETKQKDTSSATTPATTSATAVPEQFQRRCSPADDFYRQLELDIRSTCAQEGVSSVLSGVEGQKALRLWLASSSSAALPSSSSSSSPLTLKQLFTKHRLDFSNTLLVRVRKKELVLVVVVLWGYLCLTDVVFFPLSVVLLHSSSLSITFLHSHPLSFTLLHSPPFFTGAQRIVQNMFFQHPFGTRTVHVFQHVGRTAFQNESLPTQFGIQFHRWPCM